MHRYPSRGRGRGRNGGRGRVPSKNRTLSLVPLNARGNLDNPSASVLLGSDGVGSKCGGDGSYASSVVGNKSLVLLNSIEGDAKRNNEGEQSSGGNSNTPLYYSKGHTGPMYRGKEMNDNSYKRAILNGRPNSHATKRKMKWNRADQEDESEALEFSKDNSKNDSIDQKTKKARVSKLNPSLEKYPNTNSEKLFSSEEVGDEAMTSLKKKNHPLLKGPQDERKLESRKWFRSKHEDASNLKIRKCKKVPTFHHKTSNGHKRIREFDDKVDVKRIILNEEAEGKGRPLLTDYAYRQKLINRSTSSASSKGLVRVDPKESDPICQKFLRGECYDEKCRKRHDIPKESATPICSFFQRGGMCLRDNCPFLHIKVPSRAEICPQFSLKGFCSNPGCTLKHFRPKTLSKKQKI